MTNEYPAFFQPIPNEQYDQFIGDIGRFLFTPKNTKDQQKTDLQIKKGQVDILKAQNVTAQHQANIAKARAEQASHKANQEQIHAQKALVEAQTAVAHFQRANAGKWLSYFWIVGGVITVGSLVYLVIHLTSTGKGKGKGQSENLLGLNPEAPLPLELQPQPLLA